MSLFVRDFESDQGRLILLSGIKWLFVTRVGRDSYVLS